MSWDIDLEESDGVPCKVTAHTEGGTYAVGGTDNASLNVTYNYGEAYRLVGFSIDSLQGAKAKDVTAALEDAVNKLGTRRYTHDYWAPTPGNAGYALSILLRWAKLYPDAVFHVS